MEKYKRKVKEKTLIMFKIPLIKHLTIFMVIKIIGVIILFSLFFAPKYRSKGDPADGRIVQDITMITQEQ